MGLLNFWNKKTLDPAPSPPSRDFDISADLPPIDGGNLSPMNDMPGVNSGFDIPDFSNNSFNMKTNSDMNMNHNAAMDSNPLPSFNQVQQMPNQKQDYSKQMPYSVPQAVNYQAPSVAQSAVFNQKISEPQIIAPQTMPPPFDSKSLSVNIPSLDFSMPSLDDVPLIDEPLRPAELSSEANTQSNFTSILEPETNPNSQIKTSEPLENKYLDVEDLRRLFPSDDWQEPDWNTFEAYHEDKIEEPHQEDFGITEELPTFIEEEKISEPSPVENTHTTVPIELFIRGSEYNKVFLELDQMIKVVVKMDSKLASYEDIIKREESLVSESKMQMEYLYKKLASIDKKIFAQ